MSSPDFIYGVMTGLSGWALFRLLRPYRCKNKHCHYLTWNAHSMFRHVEGRHTTIGSDK